MILLQDFPVESSALAVLTMEKFKLILDDNH